MLAGKTVLLCVSGSIAAYKIAYLASALKKLKADVHVLMTRNATNFINPITFETLTGNKCLVDTFDRNFEFSVEHVSLAKAADVVLVAPASANVIAKLAHGLADDMLTTTVLACTCKKIISPAMKYENVRESDHTGQLKDLRTLRNGSDQSGKRVSRLRRYWSRKDAGAGGAAPVYLKGSPVRERLKRKEDPRDRGPTREAIDPVRYITNHSTGKMGYAIAKTAALRGAEVTLVSGPAEVEPPMFVNFVPVVTAKDMFEAVTGRSDEMDCGDQGRGCR